MKKTVYFLAMILVAGWFASCGGSEKAESVTEDTLEAPPAEPGLSSTDEDMPEPVIITNADNRITVSMDRVSPSEDTAATLISGYIDLSGFAEVPKDMSLKVVAKTSKDSREHVMQIEEDGRVPGVWVAPNADCHFTLAIAKETYSFDAMLDMALYRFKLAFKAKI